MPTSLLNLIGFVFIVLSLQFVDEENGYGFPAIHRGSMHSSIAELTYVVC